MVVIRNVPGEEWLMRETINGKVNWDGIGVRDWGSERGRESISVESKVDFIPKLETGVWSGEETKASSGHVRRQVTVDQDRGPHYLRGKKLQHRSRIPNDVCGAAFCVLCVPPRRPLAFPALAPFRVVSARDGALAEGCAIMRARCQFEMELHAGPSLEVTHPNEPALAWPDAGDEEKEREVIRLRSETHRG